MPSMLRSFVVSAWMCVAPSAAAQIYEAAETPPTDGDDTEDVEPATPIAEASPYEAGPPSVAPDAQIFENELSPYGRWMWVPNVGRVWQPYEHVVGPHFVPYSTGGQWVYGPAGWVFRTAWKWGWAPFHYGRWYLAPGYGWVWQPGYTWGSSWVVWRSAPGYVAWAPLPPPGIPISFGWGAPGWCFVERRHFARPYVHRYALPPAYFHRAAPVRIDRWRTSTPVWRGYAGPVRGYNDGYFVYRGPNRVPVHRPPPAPRNWTRGGSGYRGPPAAVRGFGGSPVPVHPAPPPPRGGRAYRR